MKILQTITWPLGQPMKGEMESRDFFRGDLQKESW